MGEWLDSGGVTPHGASRTPVGPGSAGEEVFKPPLSPRQSFHSWGFCYVERSSNILADFAKLILDDFVCGSNQA